jgi:hypothetical protein
LLGHLIAVNVSCKGYLEWPKAIPHRGYMWGIAFVLVFDYTDDKHSTDVYVHCMWSCVSKEKSLCYGDHR